LPGVRVFFWIISFLLQFYNKGLDVYILQRENRGSATLKLKVGNDIKVYNREI